MLLLFGENVAAYHWLPYIEKPRRYGVVFLY